VIVIGLRVLGNKGIGESEVASGTLVQKRVSKVFAHAKYATLQRTLVHPNAEIEVYDVLTIL
jgi:hypothetical protein